MIHVRVCFADSKYDYTTAINGTLETARAYFVGSPWGGINFGDRDWGDPDNIQTPVRVELVTAAPPQTDPAPRGTAYTGTEYP